MKLFSLFLFRPGIHCVRAVRHGKSVGKIIGGQYSKVHYRNMIQFIKYVEYANELV